MKSYITALLLCTVLLAAEASRLPSFTRGVYLLLADNTVTVKNDQGKSVLSTENWNPKLSSWINQFNVIFFTFINSDMKVPPSFENARKSGQISSSSKIIYSIGGASYSENVNAWKSAFSSKAKAKQLA
jgi:hypothetical protein